LSRNFGQVSAILAGYRASRGDAVITISADLQDPVGLMGEMVRQWEQGHEIVIAHRGSRNDDLASTIFSKLAYGIARRSNPRIPSGGFDYLLMSRRAIDLLGTFKGRHRFFQGDVLWLGLPTVFIPYARRRREHGRSGWSFGKKFKYFTDLMLDSSYLPIRMMSSIGFITACAGILYSAVIVGAWFLKRTPFPGWAPLMITLLLIGGLIMMMLGIIGEYLWRIYDDVKERPLFVVQQEIRASPEPPVQLNAPAGGQVTRAEEVSRPLKASGVDSPSEKADRRPGIDSRLHRREMIAVAAATLLITILLANFFTRTSLIRHLDTVFLFEATLSILENGRPESNSVASWPDVLKTLAMPAAEVCAAPLGRSSPEPLNVLHNHAYYALYPLALGAALTGPEVAFGIANALAHVLLLVLPFLYLRRNGVTVAPAGLFVLLVTLYPGWSYSGTGNYYLDRLAMPMLLVGLYGMFELSREGRQRSGWSALAVGGGFGAAALCSERAAIMALYAIIFFFIAYRALRIDRRKAALLLVTSGVIAAYLAAYYLLVHDGIEGGGGLLTNSAWQDPIQRFRAPGMRSFLLVNGLSLGALAILGGWRPLLLVLGAMFPNFAITIGGAELNGWATHYHTMYVPFLIFGASLGFHKAAHAAYARVGKRAAIAAVLALTAALAFAGAKLDPYSGRFEQPIFGMQRDGLPSIVSRYYLDPGASGQKAASEAIRPLSGMVPAGATVSATEGVMPALYRRRDLSLFPIDLDTSDYAVVGGSVTPEGRTTMVGAISYTGESEWLNDCLLTRMERNGYVLANTIPAAGVLILRRDRENAVSQLKDELVRR
jgi:polyisoprenyl-phosphate glycosyltransferase